MNKAKLLSKIIFVVILCFVFISKASAASNTFTCLWDDVRTCNARSDCNVEFKPTGECNLYDGAKERCEAIKDQQFSCTLKVFCDKKCGPHQTCIGDESGGKCFDSPYCDFKKCPNNCIKPTTNGGECIIDDPFDPGPGKSDDGVSPANIINIGQVINSLFPLNFRFHTETTSTLGAIISAAIPIIFGLAGMLLLLFLIKAGFDYLTSAGDAKKTEAAKNALTSAVIGFIIIITAYFVTQIVQYIFNLQGPGGSSIF